MQRPISEVSWTEDTGLYSCCQCPLVNSAVKIGSWYTDICQNSL